MNNLELKWPKFKQFVDQRAVPIQYVEINDNYYLSAFHGPLCVTCLIPKMDPASDDQAEFEADYKATANGNIKEPVQTQFEREDIRLQMSKATADFVDGEAEISIKLPGTVGVDTVFIGGGYAFTDVHTFGDCVEKVQIVDVDNILGMGAHTVVATYHDDRVATANQGWYLYPAPQAGGEIEVDPMGFYGEAVAGLYLELYFKATNATKVYVDFVFGRQTS